MAANDEEESHALKMTEQQKQIDMLESDLHNAQSELEQLELKLMESESRLQIESEIHTKTKSLLLGVTMKERQLRNQNVKQLEEKKKTEEALRNQIAEIKRETEEQNTANVNLISVRDELSAENGDLRERIHNKEDKEQKLVVVIEHLVEQVHLFSGASDKKSLTEDERNVYETAMKDFKNLETDKRNEDKDELWVRLKSALQTVGFWKERTDYVDNTFESGLSEPQQQSSEIDSKHDNSQTDLANTELKEEPTNVPDASKENQDRGASETLEPKQAQEPKSEPPLVASIDFGTCFCTWACSPAKQDQDDDSEKCTEPVVSKRVPTSALIEPDGETLQAFGFEAEHLYKELALRGAHRDHYYFLRFKMTLDSEVSFQYYTHKL